MSAVKKDFGDVVVSVVHTRMHGVPVVCETQTHRRDGTRIQWYVEAMTMLRLPAKQRLRWRNRTWPTKDAMQPDLRELATELRAK